MRKRCKRGLWVVLCVALVLSCMPITGFAANVSTVANIPQSTSAALSYLAQNVGTVNAKYTIPGLMQTVTRDSTGQNVTTCSNMVPQGIAFIGGGDYLVISAYCNCGAKHRSVLYLIDGLTREYLVTLILDANMHAGSIACDGTYIWVCDTASGHNLRAYKYSSALNAVGHNYWTLYTVATRPVDTAPSYMCYTNGYLYVGAFSETATTAKIHYYSVNDTELTHRGSFTVNGISKIQGMSIRGHAMVLSCSYGRKNASDVYIFHDPVNKFKTGGVNYYGANARHYSFANMAEGCYIGSSYTYFLFESGSKTYRESAGTRPLDQYVRYRSSDLGIITTCSHPSTTLQNAKSATCTENGYTGDYVCTTCWEVAQAGEVIPALGHSYATTVTAPTCTAQGYTTYSCSRCHETHRDNYVDALGHSWDAGRVVTEPTESSSGLKLYTCTRCGATKNETIPPLEHTHHYTTTVVEPTCTEWGYTLHTCTCGDSYTSDNTAPLGHAYGDWITLEYPTCTLNGKQMCACARCGDQQEQILPALGHHYESSVVAPTCTEQGYTVYTCACGDRYMEDYVPPLGHDYGSWVTTQPATCTGTGMEESTCSRCHCVQTRAINALGHSYTASVTAPTCTTGGYTTHICTRCNASYQDGFVSALGHDYSEWVTVKEPSCMASGLETHTCLRCNDVQTRQIAALGHNYSATVTAPTCTERGYTTHTCVRCSHTYYDTYTTELGHAWDNGVVTVEPTQTASGLRLYTCTRCAQTRTETIAPIGHNHQYTVTVVAPTCTEQGYTVHTCACGDRYVDNYTASLGHAYGDWMLTKAATCTENGLQTRTCSRCGDIQSSEIAALGHSYSAVVTEPTCTTGGCTTHTCTRCGETYQDAFTSALDHAWDEGVVTLEPTNTQNGEKTYTCTRCGQTKTQMIPSIGHTHAYIETVVAPTCTEQGYTLHKCTCGDQYIDNYTNALGHNWDNGTVTMQPTETDDGVITYTCHRCEQTKSERIACPSVQFVDVNRNLWYHKAIDFAVANHIFAGIDATHFQPNGKTTRAMFVTVLWRIDREPESSFPNPFVDVESGRYYTKAVIWAAEHRVVAGMDDSHFCPNGNVTREQAAAFLYRYASQKGYSVDAAAELAPFPDAADVSNYARANLAWAVASGLINGVRENGANYLRPKANATRAQVAQILMMFLENVAS